MPWDEGKTLTLCAIVQEVRVTLDPTICFCWPYFLCYLLWLQRWEGKVAVMLMGRKGMYLSIVSWSVIFPLAFTISKLSSTFCSFRILTCPSHPYCNSDVNGLKCFFRVSQILYPKEISHGIPQKLSVSPYLHKLIMLSMIRQLLLAKFNCYRKQCLPTGKHVHIHR